MNTIPDDTMLIAYLDGELDEEAVRTVERYLRHDAAAQERVDRLQKSAALSRIAFNDILHAPLPERIVALIDDARENPQKQSRSPSPSQEDTAPHDRGTVSRLSAHRRRPHSSWRIALPVAATIAGIAIGLAGGYGITGWRTEKKQEAAAVLRQHELAAVNTLRNTALENHISGQTVTWKNPDATAFAMITPVRTYKDKNGQFCREYRQQTHFQGQADEAYGVACRTGNGQWQPRYMIVTPKGGSL